MLKSSPIALLLALFLLLAVGYSVAAPLGEAPDEVGHFSYVEYLVTYHRLSEAAGEVSGEAKQPPLYYMLGALVTFFVPREGFQVIANPDFKLTDPQAPNLLLHTRREAFPYQGEPLAWHLLRLLSIGLAAITIYATWRIGMEVLSIPWIAIGGAAFVAFLPEFLFVSASVNNDNLVTALSSLAILQCVWMLRQPPTRRASLGLGLLLGLAALAKLNGLVVWIFAVIPFLWEWRSKKEWRPPALNAALCYAAAAFVVLPWVIYNLSVYGDPLGWILITSVSDVRTAPLTAGDWVTLVQRLLLSFAGRFGGASHIDMLPLATVLLGGLAGAGLLGWILYAQDARRRVPAAGMNMLLGLFAAFWIVLLAAHARWTLTALGTDQSRLLFPGVPLLGLFLAAGLARLFGTRAPIALRAWSVALLAIGALGLIYLNGIYAPPPDDRTIAQSDPSRPGADFGQTIRVLNYGVTPTRGSPGNSITVQINWEALSETREDYWLLLQLADAEGAAVNQDGVPSAGRLTTDWWQRGQRLSSNHTILVPPDLAPGTYDLRLGLHPFGRWDWLPVRGSDMLVLTQITVVAAQ